MLMNSEIFIDMLNEILYCYIKNDNGDEFIQIKTYSFWCKGEAPSKSLNDYNVIVKIAIFVVIFSISST